MTVPFATMLQLPVHRSPERNGDLSVLDIVQQLPFETRRVFWVGALLRGDIRAGHANTVVHEALTCVHGGIRVHLRHAGHEQVVELQDPGQLLVIPPATWVDIEVLADNSLYVAFASHDYATAKEHYIHDSIAFRKRYG
jgi:UDP-2-acetamido-3-amino-2,3-dideoxy-glucuronate N-acetyltransferase